MKKQIGSTLLVAGTCMGSGMTALPIVLAKVGIIPSFIVMGFIWALCYYTALINLELNLQAGKGLPLGALGKLYSGKKAQLTGILALKILSYALVAVYIYGGTSIIQKLLENSGVQAPFIPLATGLAMISFMIFLLPMKMIDYINRFLFLGLIGIFSLLIIGLVSSLNWTNLPLISPKATDLFSWQLLIPVVFTSFGFQVIFHTLTTYCDRDPVVLKKAFFWGSLIPALIYMIWTFGILSLIYHHSPHIYQKMVDGNLDIGELIHELSLIAKWPLIQLLVWWISILAILASLIGVGIALVDSLKGMMISLIPRESMRTVSAALITILPAYLVAILVPNAFISVLGFAGMILVVIAILLPLYLFWKMRRTRTVTLFYPELGYTGLLILSGISGVIIIACKVMYW